MINLEQRKIRLWDGKEYRVDYLNQMSPELCQHAKSHRRLHEWLPVGLGRIVRDYFFLWLAVTLLIELLALVVAIFRTELFEFPQDPLVPVFMGVSIIFMIGLPLWLLPTVLRGPIKLSVENGRITLQYARGWGDRQIDVPLAACAVYRTPMRVRDRLRTMRRTDGGVVLLLPRRGCWRILGCWRPISCGCTPAKCELWLTFFMIAGVRHLVPSV